MCEQRSYLAVPRSCRFCAAVLVLPMQCNKHAATSLRMPFQYPILSYEQVLSTSGSDRFSKFHWWVQAILTRFSLHLTTAKARYKSHPHPNHHSFPARSHN
ncbi:hypothetical protein PMIN03_009862 [Paraphaeosphaeria minitans]